MSALKAHPPAARAAAKALCETVLEGFLEPVRRVARDSGYSIAVHGSVARDIDLVAIPWTEQASTNIDGLADRIAAVVASIYGRCNIRRFSDADDEKGWKNMPHGRKAIMLMVWSDLFGHLDIDLSVMPTLAKPDEVGSETPATNG